MNNVTDLSLLLNNISATGSIECRIPQRFRRAPNDRHAEGIERNEQYVHYLLPDIN